MVFALFVLVVKQSIKCEKKVLWKIKNGKRKKEKEREKDESCAVWKKMQGTKRKLRLTSDGSVTAGQRLWVWRRKRSKKRFFVSERTRGGGTRCRGSKGARCWCRTCRPTCAASTCWRSSARTGTWCARGCGRCRLVRGASALSSTPSASTQSRHASSWTAARSTGSSSASLCCLAGAALAQLRVPAPVHDQGHARVLRVRRGVRRLHLHLPHRRRRARPLRPSRQGLLRSRRR